MSECGPECFENKPKANPRCNSAMCTQCIKFIYYTKCHESNDPVSFMNRSK